MNEQVDIARKQVNCHLTCAQAMATSRLSGVKTELRLVILGLVALTETLRAGSRPVQPYVELSVGQVRILFFMGQVQRLTGLQIHEIGSPGSWHWWPSGNAAQEPTKAIFRCYGLSDRY